MFQLGSISSVRATKYWAGQINIIYTFAPHPYFLRVKAPAVNVIINNVGIASNSSIDEPEPRAQSPEPLLLLLLKASKTFAKQVFFTL